MLAFSTATINDANAAAVGQAMAERLRDDIVAHAAWSLVEEYTATSGAVRWYVFQCDDASSGLSSDFYVVMGRTIATGELRFAIGEGYNAGTHTLSRYAAVATGSVAYDAVGANPNTYVLGTTAFSGADNTPKYSSWIPGGASAKFWLIVDDDGFTVAWGGLSEGFVHLGAYIPLMDQANTCPLQIIGYDLSGGITRNPSVVSQTVNGLALEIQGGGTANTLDGGTTPLGYRGDIRYLDKFHSNQSLMAEIGMVMYLGGTPNLMATYGWAVGKQKRMRVGSGSAPAGFVWGDSYVLDGELWVPFKATDLRIWNTGVAV